MLQTANPAFNDDTFRAPRVIDVPGKTVHVSHDQLMTVQGAVNKTGLLLGIAFVAAMMSWNLATTNPSSLGIITFAGAIGGFIVAMITIFKKEWSGMTAPIYAILEGLFLGGFSALYAAMYQGIILQAVLLTFGTLFAMLVAYTSGVIKVTEKFAFGVAAAMGAIALTYFINFVLSWFGMTVPFLHDSGPIGIGISLVIVGVAALNLVLNFDYIRQGAASNAPKYMEWYSGFGMLVALVWLYIEMVRLLGKFNQRR